MATIVKMGTKKAEELIYDFTHKYYKGETLYEVYGRCSSAKINSWEKIKRTCEEMNGWNLHITGASSHQYSCMYAFQHIDDETGEVFIVLRKETSCNTYDLYMTVEEYERSTPDELV
jgi:hypothetical protein